MHLENCWSISSAQTCRHEALICWNTTAVIGWPVGHKSSFWQWRVLGKKTIWNGKQNVSENGKLCFVSASRSQWKQLTTLKTNETLLEVFLFEGLLAVSLFLPLLYFHFQLREKEELCFVTGSEIKENQILGLFFHLTAGVAGWDFMQTNLIVLIVCWYSVFLCDYKILKIIIGTLQIMQRLFFPFRENWTLLPLMTYSQTDTKAFSCMVL